MLNEGIQLWPWTAPRIRGSRQGHQAATFTQAKNTRHCCSLLTGSMLQWYSSTGERRDMSDSGQATTIELGMKVSVRRSGQNRIGVVTKLAGDYVVIRWTTSDFAEIEEYHAHRDDVTPLAGWL